jgi:hypothetical protein
MLARAHLLIVGATVLLGVLAVAAPPFPPRPVGQGDGAVVFAERACLDYDVTPGTVAYEICVSRAAKAFEQGEPDVAYMQARATREARDVCLSNGLQPQTPGYTQCVVIQSEKSAQPSMLMR